MPSRRHARAGRSPRASEVGVRGEPAPRVDRTSACDTLTAHDGRPDPSLVRAVLNGSAPDRLSRRWGRHGQIHQRAGGPGGQLSADLTTEA